MTLDIVSTAAQVGGMADQLAASAERMRPVPDFARDLFARWHARHEDAVGVLESAEQGGVWPFAMPLDPLLVTRSTAAADGYAVVATDGSQIDVDSHGLVHCFLINVGVAAIAYGDRPDASLLSEPTVYHQDADLFAAPDDEGPREIGDQQLSMLRTVAEIERLAQAAEAWRERRGLVAIADGNLVRWELGGKAPTPGAAALLRRFTAALARFRLAGIPICSYISRPNAREVANMAAILAVHDCDRKGRGPCDRCRERPDRLCEALRVLADRDLFGHLLPGQSSGLYRPLAPVMAHYAPEDRIVFCYARNEAETVRLELPQWAAAPESLASILSAVQDQCRRGRGYPVVLMEAHEQAVIHGADREAFRDLVLAALNGRRLEAAVSSKRLSKDQRAV
jgi:hypothetical protein